MLEEVKTIRSKIVKIRRPRKCFHCNLYNVAGSKMELHVVAYAGGVTNNYRCIDANCADSTVETTR